LRQLSGPGFRGAGLERAIELQDRPAGLGQRAIARAAAGAFHKGGANMAFNVPISCQARL